MRTVLLIVALLFIGGLAALTALDIARYGLTGLDVLAVLSWCCSHRDRGALTHRPPPVASHHFSSRGRSVARGVITSRGHH